MEHHSRTQSCVTGTHRTAATAQCDGDMGGKILGGACRRLCVAARVPALSWAGNQAIRHHPASTETISASFCALPALGSIAPPHPAVRCVRGKAGSLACVAPLRFTFLPAETVFWFHIFAHRWESCGQSPRVPLPHLHTHPFFFFSQATLSITWLLEATAGRILSHNCKQTI